MRPDNDSGLDGGDHACLTGDCSHDNANECVSELRGEIARMGTAARRLRELNAAWVSDWESVCDAAGEPRDVMATSLVGRIKNMNASHATLQALGGTLSEFGIEPAVYVKPGGGWRLDIVEGVRRLGRAKQVAEDQWRAAQDEIARLKASASGAPIQPTDADVLETIANDIRHDCLQTIYPAELERIAAAVRAALSAPPPPEPRQFPVQQYGLIPWHVAERAYEVYARKFGRQQSLERLAERGGFGVEEMDMFAPGWRTPPPEPVVRWCVKDPKGALRVSTMEISRAEAEHWCAGNGVGWSVVRVEIREVPS